MTTTTPPKEQSLESLRKQKADLEAEISKELNISVTSDTLIKGIIDETIPETVLVNEWLFVASLLDDLENDS